MATETDEIELPALTPNQFAYVQGVLAGKSLIDAYTAAYDTSNMQKTTAWVRASELSRHSKIKVWLDAARKAGQLRVNLTLDHHLTELERLKGKAEADGQFNAAIRAEESRGKAAGLYIERHADVTDLLNPVEILKQIAALNPDIAAELAKRHSLEVEKQAAGTVH